MTLTFSVVTLGCKTNQFESISMEEKLAKVGYRPVSFDEGADLVVVNTCTVTAATDAQSRNLIRRARRMNPDCRVIVTGCYAQVDPEAIRSISGVSVVLGNDDKKDLVKYLEFDPVEPLVEVSDIQSVIDAVPHEISSFADRSRAFVQIQNGCNAYCSYCIIPYARGRSRSAPPEQVIEQVRRLEENGYPEIVLTGIHIGAYGTDLQPASSLVELIRRVETETAVRRLRLGSIEPNEIDDRLIEQIAGSAIVCPHLHIPLQAGDDNVLKRMNRHYSTGEFSRLVDRIKGRIPDVAFGFDVITGFPGESEAEFANTCRLIDSLPVAFLHVFPYSRRPGTPAADMADQVPGDVARQRAALLRELGQKKQRHFAEQFIGRTLEVAVERSSGKSGLRKGLTRHYLPVRFRDSSRSEDRVAQVKISSWCEDHLFGERLTDL